MKKRELVYGLLLLVWLAVSCKRKNETPQNQATATEKVKEKEVVEGGSLNKFFPKAQGDFSITFTQEKDGFAQAELKKSGNTVATLAISDIANNSSAADKYASATDKIAGYPMVKSGGKGTAILVANKYQVQVRSTADDFSEPMRKEWIEKFNLSGLSNLKK